VYLVKWVGIEQKVMIVVGTYMENVQSFRHCIGSETFDGDALGLGGGMDESCHCAVESVPYFFPHNKRRFLVIDSCNKCRVEIQLLVGQHRTHKSMTPITART
jgi:hypothetical protein